MHILRADFKSAVAWLADRFGESAVQIAGSDYARSAAQQAESPRFVAPIPSPPAWPAVRADLVAQQLPGGLLDQLHEQGLIYADADGAVVFLQRDWMMRAVTGAHRLIADRFSGPMLGSDMNKGRFYWLRGGLATDAVQRVVVGQTPMDALALGLRSPLSKVRTMYLAVDGVLPLEYLQGFSAKWVRVAMNRDALGERLAQQARQAFPQVGQVRPEQADWIGMLQVGRAQAVQRQIKAQIQIEQI